LKLLVTAPPISQLQAPATWRTVDLISDLHLQANEPATFAAWQSYMTQTPADAVLILGDLFEVWVGDDAVPSSPFLQSCTQVLQGAGERLHLGIMHGNRDFLMGTTFLNSCHAHFLPDPTLLTLGASSWLLSHGDALCTEDVEYQAFRQQVRSPAWIDSFINKPLAERQALARGLRAESESRKEDAVSYADADTALCLAWLAQTTSRQLIHGHTHQPANHVLAQAGVNPMERIVLSDWDLQAHPPRAQVLRLSAGGQHQRIDLT
jgi:UDP-2,3-diacylglucosamine hydrolase